MKKAQVSIFILMAVVLLIAALFLTSVNEKPELQFVDNSQVNLFIESCLKQTAEDAIASNAKKGGFYLDPLSFVYYSQNDIPFYLFQNRNVSPTKEMLESSLSFYIENHLQYCLDEFSSIPGSNIVIEDSVVESTLTQDSLFLDLSMNTDIIYSDSIETLEVFSAFIETDYLQNYETALEIVGNENDPEWMCISCISDISAQKNQQVVFEAYDDETMIFKVYSNKTQEIEFTFANRYLT